MLLVPTYVAPSKIDGIGLFAAEPIQRGTSWWRFDSSLDRVFSLVDLYQLSPEARRHIERFGFLQDGAWTLCGDLAIFVNHSFDPPSEHQGDESVAVRDIAKDEEITEDYRQFDETHRSFLPYVKR